jgi:2-polyprenyl-6-methoxyphenol hydroxylase-like FAD-dependent oxidoreductase
MPFSSSKILISGAGIAGPAFAYWLKRYGFAPTVVERAPKPREGGYVFHLHGATGIEVLKRMGLWATILEKRRVDKETIFVNASNVTFARLNTGPTTAAVEPSGMQVTVKRADLARVLYEYTKDSVEYIFGNSISAISENAHGVEVVFEKGDRRRFGLVVGADGLHSQVRTLVFGEEAHLKRYLGYYVAAFTVHDYPAQYGVDITYTVPGKLALLFGLSENSAIANFVFKQEMELGYGEHDIEKQKQLLFEAFKDEGWEVPKLLELMKTATDFYFDSVSQIRMDRWSKGRVALIGDAAYCPTLLSGHGAQLGLAGAYVLAGELKASGGNFHSAFQAYERELRPFVEDKQKNPKRAATFIPGSTFGLWIRDQALRLASIPWVSQLVIKITYGRLLRDTFVLKEYDKK